MFTAFDSVLGAPLRRLVAALALGVVLAVPAAAARADEVTVFAAASLKTALDEIAAAWKAAGGGEVRVSYAGSSALARQIEQGAPADVFVSADLDWMAHVRDKGLVRAGTEVRLLGNAIVLVAPAGSQGPVDLADPLALAAALADGRLAMANVDAVPAGRYGKAALTALGLWRSVEAKVAQADNVRAALMLVSRGEAPLGIVYATDAAADPGVRIVARFPADSHPPIVYPAAVLAGAASPDARDLRRFSARRTPARSSRRGASSGWTSRSQTERLGRGHRDRSSR
ncbi:Molybdate-binding periplasmic protein precursor [Methylobrevis pamukkalensis]|uniref:Molybdate-binding periplasmic protein n=1 Tax=Methylobrevis pamukkalensis TaxID=1439726 RepID=A0A1E3H4R4_9HYPH|nr:Molybdate-binding periplasmic protein precursor [Methylobrevis pamukkalensis]